MRIDELDRQQAVITTREVLDKSSSITTVVVDEDGDLQFLGRSGASEADARVVSLNQVLLLDDTLHDLPELTINARYERSKVTDDPWTLTSR